MPKFLLPILVVALAAAASLASETPAVPQVGTVAQRLASLRRVVLTEDNPVLRTAAAELQRWCKLDLPVVVATEIAENDLVLSRIRASPAQPLIRAGLTNLHNTAPEQDAFQILDHGRCLWILGGSWRGVMQGAHELTLCGDSADASAALDKSGQFAMRYRTFSPLIGGQMFTGKIPPATVRECMRYLSLMGASHVAVTHDFASEACDLHRYVESGIFPKAGDAAKRQLLHTVLRQMIDGASAYGLGVFFDGRLLPCQGGPWIPQKGREQWLEQFPAELLSDCGTYQGKVLCFGHPQVQAYYKEVIGSFLRDFPEVEVFHYLVMDSNAEFCEPETCPRCHGMSKFAQRDRISRFLAETMGKERPGIQIINTSFQWDRPMHGIGELLGRQAELPASVGLCMPATGDSATFDRQSHDTLRQARAVTARAGQLFLGRDAMHVFEDMPFDNQWIVDYPLGIAPKIRRWDALKADGFFDIRGRQNCAGVSANSLACRAALLNPVADPEPFVRALALRWFGPAAGPEVMAGWEALERGQAIRSAGYSFPSSSKLSEYVGWHINKSKARLPLPTNPGFTGKQTLKKAPDRGELVAAPANGWTYHAGSYVENLQTTGQCLTDAAACYGEAARHLENALARPLPERIPDASLWLGHDVSISPKDYLRRHLAYVRGLERLGAFMGCQFQLQSLYARVDGNATSYRQQGAAWLKSYSAAALSLADYVGEQNDEKFLTESATVDWTPAILRSLSKDVDAWLADPDAMDGKK